MKTNSPSERVLVHYAKRGFWGFSDKVGKVSKT